MKKIYNKLLELYRLDRTDEGESNKLVIVLRTVELVMMLYFTVCTIYFLGWHKLEVAARFCAMGLAFVGLLYMSYKAKRVRTQIIVVNVVALAAVFVSFLIFGPGTLVRNYFIALVVLVYFSGYGNYVKKGIYAAFVCFLYLILQYNVNKIVPTLNINVWNQYFLQMMNIIFPFFCVAIVCHVYSNDSQHLEGKLIEYNNLLKKQANTDPLTGLCNRRSTIEYIENLIKKSEYSFCVCMCDIDYFKKVNDTYGHDIGDNVLRGLAKTMLEGLPKNCIVSRWGGEEFLIVFPNLNGDDAREILDVIRSRVKKMVFDVSADKHFSITVTYGLAEYGFSGGVDEIVKEADGKLYYGKEHGRDQVVF